MHSEPNRTESKPESSFFSLKSTLYKSTRTLHNTHSTQLIATPLHSFLFISSLSCHCRHQLRRQLCTRTRFTVRLRFSGSRVEAEVADCCEDAHVLVHVSCACAPLFVMRVRMLRGHSNSNSNSNSNSALSEPMPEPVPQPTIAT